MSEEPKQEATTPFGETDLGSAMGCGFIILCGGLSLAAIIWAISQL